MSEHYVEAARERWLPLALRVTVVSLLAPGAAIKFVDYGGQAAFFADLGVPASGVTVLAVGLVEAAAVVAVALGAAGRVAALAVLPIMATAMLAAGANAANVGVLLGCAGLVAVGTGDYSLWTPGAAVAERVVDSPGDASAGPAGEHDRR